MYWNCLKRTSNFLKVKHTKGNNLYQTAYIKSLLDEFKLECCKTVKTPIAKEGYNFFSANK